MSKSIHTPPEKDTDRLEAFSDVMFAIAITLLMVVTVFPFPTSLLVEYIRNP